MRVRAIIGSTGLIKHQIPFFKQELDAGRLRQGWGYADGQDLRRREINDGASGNIGIFDRVKRGDILLIPRLPDWGKVSIAEATEDFDVGYKFLISPEMGDYGHIFPAKVLKTFLRSSSLVTGDLKKTLRFPKRFKSIYYDGCGREIEALINADDAQRHTPQNSDERAATAISQAIRNSFDEQKFEEELWAGFNKQYNAAEWEEALIFMLRKQFPFYEIERTGGASEKAHGTDILVLLPGIVNDYQYAIAIQVKDYSWVVGEGVISQIQKADHWNTKDNISLIDKIVIITNAKEDDNKHLIGKELARSNREVKFIFAKELRGLLSDIAKSSQLSDML